MTDNPVSEPGRPAMNDERQRFVRYIAPRSSRDLAAIGPLPYRRVLTRDEERHLWSAVESRWRIEGRRYPRMAGDPPPDVMAFHTDYFDTQKQEALRDILSGRGIARLWELR